MLLRTPRIAWILTTLILSGCASPDAPPESAADLFSRLRRKYLEAKTLTWHGEIRERDASESSGRVVAFFDARRFSLDDETRARRYASDGVETLLRHHGVTHKWEAGDGTSADLRELLFMWGHSFTHFSVFSSSHGSAPWPGWEFFEPTKMAIEERRERILVLKLTHQWGDQGESEQWLTIDSASLVILRRRVYTGTLDFEETYDGTVFEAEIPDVVFRMK